MECRITALPVLPAPRRNLQPSKKALVKPNSLKETYFVLKINLLLLSQEAFLHPLLLNTTLSASKSFTPVIFTRKQEGLKHRSTFNVTESIIIEENLCVFYQSNYEMFKLHFQKILPIPICNDTFFVRIVSSVLFGHGHQKRLC